MSKSIFLLGLLLSSLCSFGQSTLSGTIVDEKGLPLEGAHIVLVETQTAIFSDSKGFFEFTGLTPNVSYPTSISYVGYETMEQTFRVSKTKYVVRLVPIAYELADLVVRGVKASANDPFTHTNLNKAQIEKENVGQDVPFALQYTPSIVVSSDAGNGIGYTGIRVRGSDPTRTNVTINGVPINDAESQSVYWVNMPDILSSAQSVQIQRGVGVSTNGAGAFGASIHLKTTSDNEVPFAKITSGIGSFQSFRNSVQFGTGRSKNGWAAEGRASFLQSDGYIDRATSDLRSFYAGISRKGKKSQLDLIAFTGKERTYQAWNGVPITFLDNDETRTFNPSGTEKQGTPYENEVDNYGQTYFQAIYAIALNNQWNLSAVSYTTLGQGFYEQYKSDRDPATYLITPITGSNNVDIVRQLWLDNVLLGANLQLERKPTENGIHQLWGLSASHYMGEHFGRAIKYTNLGVITDIENPVNYYFNDASKLDISGFYKVQIPRGAWNWFGDVQVRGLRYQYEGLDRDFSTIDATENLLFINPKAGFTYNPSNAQQWYASIAVGQREPNRNDFTEAFQGDAPQSEQLYNLETGWRFNSSQTIVEVNGYLMYYNNQLVVNGAINDVGANIRVNVPSSYRAGIEISGAQLFPYGLSLQGALTISDNRILDHEVFFDNWDTGVQDLENFGNAPLAFSPSIVQNLRAAWQVPMTGKQTLEFTLGDRYVSRQYLDNTGRKSASLDPYLLFDGGIHYSIPFAKRNELKIYGQVQNILATDFTSNGWIYTFNSPSYDPRPDDPYVVTDPSTQGRYNMIGMFPQAGRLFFAGISLSF